MQSSDHHCWKRGHGLNGVSTINLVPFTQAEMDEYNATIDGDYKL